MDSDSPSDIVTSTEGGKAEKPRCTATKPGGERCKAYALGEAYGEVSHLCAGHAGLGRGRKAVKADAPGSEGLGQAVGASGRVDVRDTVREALIEIDPKALKAYIQKAVLEGRDVRAITTLLDRVYGDEAVHVEVPHTFDELAKLDREQRRTLMRQLERDGFGPFTAPTH